jgi:hypothetical protein
MRPGGRVTGVRRPGCRTPGLEVGLATGLDPAAVSTVTGSSTRAGHRLAPRRRKGLVLEALSPTHCHAVHDRCQPLTEPLDAPVTRFRAAGAQQLCSAKPREPPRTSPPGLVECPATQGFVVGVVVGIPRWHARGQGFKSPQLHPRSEALSAVDRPRIPAFAQQTCRNRQCAADALIQRCGSTAIGKVPRREAALGDGSPASSRRLQHWPLFQPSSGTHLHSSFIDRTFGETAEVKVIGRLPGERSCLSLMWTCSTGPATLGEA